MSLAANLLKVCAIAALLKLASNFCPFQRNFQNCVKHSLPERLYTILPDIHIGLSIKKPCKLFRQLSSYGASVIWLGMSNSPPNQETKTNHHRAHTLTPGQEVQPLKLSPGPLPQKDQKIIQSIIIFQDSKDRQTAERIIARVPDRQ